jgi:hypothetical protein
MDGLGCFDLVLEDKAGGQPAAEDEQGGQNQEVGVKLSCPFLELIISLTF